MVISKLNPPNLNPPPQPPQQLYNMTIVGKLLYPSGPWGSKRPVRHRGSVLVREGILFNPHGFIKEKKPTGPSEQVALDRIAAGGPVDMALLFGNKKLLSHEKFTEADGSFSITTDPIVPYTPMVLEMRDYNFVSAGEDARTCFLDLRPYIDFSPSSINLFSQGVGSRIMPWWPPKFMTQVAVVNQVAFHDTHKLAHRLSELAKSPTYPTTIRIARESGLSQVNLVGDDFTEGQELFRQLTDPKVLSGLPQRLFTELVNVPQLSLRRPNIAVALAEMLGRLVSVNIGQMESGAVLGSILAAIGTAVSKRYFGPPDPPEDMAVACAMIAVAAMMARDGAKPSVSLQAQKLANDQKMLTLEIKITK